MKESQIMNRGCPLLVVLLLSGSFPVAAHDQGGALGKAASAKDIYTVVCSEGDPLKTKLVAAVSDLAPKKPPRIKVEISRDGQLVSSIDSIDADLKYSPFTEIQKGDGSYSVAISKLPKTDAAKSTTLNFPEIYSLQFHCMTGSEHTTTDIYVNQNQ
ncbi:MAG: hypothetical protein ACOYLM_11265 [Methylococcaceae bacterium]